VLLNRLLRPLHPDAVDPNESFDEQFWRMLVASHQASVAGGASAARPVPQSVAIVYPTDLPEDLSMIAIYKQWLEARGCEVTLGSPFNLGDDGRGRVTVLGEPVDLIVRHYKTDWWGERETIWTNQAPFEDPDPLTREITLLLEAESEGRVAVVNPFGAVVTQNKFAMALMWERQDLFSEDSKAWIAEYIPETRRLTAVNPEALKREEWVLKSDYGCEGDSVLVGPFVKPQDWQLALATVIPEHWIAQRFFEVAPIQDGEDGEDGENGEVALPNYGVYLIGGRAAGFYTRLSQKSTNYASMTAPTFIRPE
jgi:hypothetical protein